MDDLSKLNEGTKVHNPRRYMHVDNVHTVSPVHTRYIRGQMRAFTGKYTEF